MSKINLKEWKKYYFGVFLNKKNFEKQPLPQYQTGSEMFESMIIVVFQTVFYLKMH